MLINGSGNWSSTAVSINLENLSRLTTQSHNDVVNAFDCAFDVLWTGNSQIFNSRLRRCETTNVKFSPAPRHGDNPAKLITDSIEQTTASIDISMHHLTNQDVYAALAEALNRGVVIRFLFDDDDCNQRQNTSLANLIQRGALVRYVPTNCSLFQLAHNKFGIFDGQTVVNGSGNWSQAGLSANYENFIKFDSQADVLPFQTFYDHAWNIATDGSACTCAAGNNQCLQRYCIEP